MRELSRVVLTMLATVLALWLVLGFWPLSGGSRFALCLCILLTGGAVLWRQWRRFRRLSAAREQREENNLPPEEFQGAVVFVCGDTASLFSQGLAHRETRQGWYLRVENAEQLPLLAQHLVNARPDLIPGSQQCRYPAYCRRAVTAGAGRRNRFTGWALHRAGNASAKIRRPGGRCAAKR